MTVSVQRHSLSTAAEFFAQHQLGHITKTRSNGSTVLLVEQNAAAALNVADRAYIMKSGAIIDERPAREFLADKTLAQAYLGGGDLDAMERRIRRKALTYLSEQPDQPDSPIRS